MLHHGPSAVTTCAKGVSQPLPPGEEQACSAATTSRLTLSGGTRSSPFALGLQIPPSGTARPRPMAGGSLSWLTLIKVSLRENVHGGHYSPSPARRIIVAPVTAV